MVRVYALGFREMRLLIQERRGLMILSVRGRLPFQMQIMIAKTGFGCANSSWEIRYVVKGSLMQFRPGLCII